MYQVPHNVAWFYLDYGGNPEGIFTTVCPPEALHAIENGIYHHVLKEVFIKILKTTTCSYLDAHIKTWNAYPSQHYLNSSIKDSYPRLLYTSRVSKLTELKADDKVGIIFCIVIAAIQEEGCNKVLNCPYVDNALYIAILYVFEAMLSYRAWLK